MKNHELSRELVAHLGAVNSLYVSVASSLQSNDFLVKLGSWYFLTSEHCNMMNIIQIYSRLLTVFKSSKDAVNFVRSRNLCSIEWNWDQIFRVCLLLYSQRQYMARFNIATPHCCYRVEDLKFLTLIEMSATLRYAVIWDLLARLKTKRPKNHEAEKIKRPKIEKPQIKVMKNRRHVRTYAPPSPFPRHGDGLIVCTPPVRFTPTWLIDR